MNRITQTGILALGVVTLAAGSAVAQQTTAFNYNNTTTPLGTSYAPGNGTEFGNELFFNNAASVNIDSYSFEYSGVAATAEVKIYANNGPDINPGFNNTAAPGTMVYDSGTFAVAAAPNGQVVSFGTGGSLGISVPGGRFTWTVTFTGASGSVGLDFYGPPTGAVAGNSILKNSGSGWGLFANSQNGGLSTFGSTFVGSVVSVPEPTTYALAGLGLMAFALSRFVKTKAA